jgi:hypothetical protein
MTLLHLYLYIERLAMHDAVHRLDLFWIRIERLRDAAAAANGFGAFVVVLYVAPIGTGSV